MRAGQASLENAVSALLAINYCPDVPFPEVAERFAPFLGLSEAMFGYLGTAGTPHDASGGLDLGTSQACAMKIPAFISGTGESFAAWCKMVSMWSRR
jgi:hypothetical protein